MDKLVTDNITNRLKENIYRQLFGQVLETPNNISINDESFKQESNTKFMLDEVEQPRAHT